MRRLSILEASKLVPRELISSLHTRGPLAVSVTNEQAKKIQNNWERYAQYWLGKKRSPRSLFTMLKGLIWVFHRAYLNIQNPELGLLITVYCEYGACLQPVRFEKNLDQNQEAIFEIRR
jgi:hypothetical protein